MSISLHIYLVDKIEIRGYSYVITLFLYITGISSKPKRAGETMNNRGAKDTQPKA